jgi:hypothetical protein
LLIADECRAAVQALPPLLAFAVSAVLLSIFMLAVVVEGYHGRLAFGFPCSLSAFIVIRYYIKGKGKVGLSERFLVLHYSHDDQTRQTADRPRQARFGNGSGANDASRAGAIRASRRRCQAIAVGVD